MVGMLAPKFREVILGRAEVREVFKVSKVGTIAGCYVQSGKLTRNAKVRILRDNAVVFESELESLRRFKDDVREVAENFECGVQIARFSTSRSATSSKPSPRSWSRRSRFRRSRRPARRAPDDGRAALGVGVLTGRARARHFATQDARTRVRGRSHDGARDRAEPIARERRGRRRGRA
jgi:hypothetical protein